MSTVLWVDLTEDSLEKVILAFFIGVLLETVAKQPVVVSSCYFNLVPMTNDLIELVICPQLYWLALVNKHINSL